MFNQLIVCHHERFIQPDTLVANAFNPQDLNRYAYVRNNPMIYTDPTGHVPEDEDEDEDEDGYTLFLDMSGFSDDSSSSGPVETNEQRLNSYNNDQNLDRSNNTNIHQDQHRTSGMGSRQEGGNRETSFGHHFNANTQVGGGNQGRSSFGLGNGLNPAYSSFYDALNNEFSYYSGLLERGFNKGLEYGYKGSLIGLGLIGLGTGVGTAIEGFSLISAKVYGLGAAKFFIGSAATYGSAKELQGINTPLDNRVLEFTSGANLAIDFAHSQTFPGSFKLNPVNITYNAINYFRGIYHHYQLKK